MDTKQKKQIMSLAAKYENKEFLIGDPSWFMHQIEGESNKELLAFIASALSYGSRKQFLPKIQYILDDITSAYNIPDKINVPTNLVADWLVSGRYSNIIPNNDDCYYRLYSNQTFNDFLSALADIVREYGSLKNLIVAKSSSNKAIKAIEIITKEFKDRGSVGVIPKNTSSSCKRVCMFLRWMVRDNSPVDIGIWADIIDRKTLIIPMDTHVVQEANNFGLLDTKTTTMSTALKLTNKLSEIFPDDPLKGDFALFGLGIDKAN